MATKQHVAREKYRVLTRHRQIAIGVSKQELKDAFQMFPGQMMTAASFNNRFNLLLDILFGADPATLRKEVAVLMEER